MPRQTTNTFNWGADFDEDMMAKMNDEDGGRKADE